MRKKKPPLGGIAEIAKALGASRQAISNWRARDPSFPAPLVMLRMGPVWDLRVIRRWKAKRR